MVPKARMNVLCVLSAVLSAVRAEAATEKKPVYLGIDLGTTFSAAQVHDPSTGLTFPLTYGTPERVTLPSTLYASSVDENNNPIMKVGYEANDLNCERPSPNGYFYGHKRLMGVSNLEDHKDLVSFPDHVTYKVLPKKTSSGSYYVFPVEVDGKPVAELTPTDLAALVLGEIKKEVERLGYTPVQVSVTTPAYFTATQDGETRRAAELAGLGQVVITKEPVAACLTYVKEENMPLDKEEDLMVFDFGGGTLDISIVEVVKELDEDVPAGAVSSISVSKLTGDNFLGGENVNNELVSNFLTKIKAQTGKQLAPQSSDRLRLRLFAEDFKIKLCNKQRKAAPGVVASHSDSFVLGDDTSCSISLTMTEFDKIVEPVYKRVRDLFFDPTHGMFRKEAGNPMDPSADPDTIKKIILVGGSTRIPYIRKFLGTICKNAKLYDGIDADMAVARGACHTCMLEAGDSSVVLTNVVPLSIGIEVKDGWFQPIIQKDAKIPTYAVMPFTTVQDNQRVILLRVASGLRPLFKDNESIGEFSLILDSPAPAGVPKIEVRIDYYADYSFKVTAKDSGTGKMVSKSFTSAYGKPSQSKIDAILAAAKENEEMDKEAEKNRGLVQKFMDILGTLEAHLKSGSLQEEDQLHFETVLQANREWLEQHKSTATSSILEAKIAALEAELEELLVRLSKAAESPAEEKQPVEEEEKGGRDLF